MTPDMKRLCLATIKAHDEWYGDRFSITPAGAEEIVRAVLMALKDLNQLSDQVLDAIGDAAVDGAAQSINARLLRQAQAGRKGPIGLAPAEWLAPSLEAMIDGILDTKARRAAALKDLADIDRDLL